MNARTDFKQTLHDAPFFQVPRQSVTTSEGVVELPIMYYDTSMLNAFFLVDSDKVSQVLQGTGLAPALTVGGKSVVGLACFEYRDTSVGIYNEVGVAIAVAPQGEKLNLGGWQDLITTLRQPEERRVAFHIIDLPVTTAAANAAGREIWGYPKFITQIPFSLNGRQFDCAVSTPQGDGFIMRLAGKMGPSIPATPLSLTLLSLLDGKLLRSTVNVRGTQRMALPGSLTLEVSDSLHPMAQRLHALGMDGATPFAISWTHDFQSRLNGGVSV